MARVVFFARDTRENLRQLEYYKQDVDALGALGHEVVVCTRYREIPLRFDAMFVWWWTHAALPVLICRFLGRPCIVTGTFNLRFPPQVPRRDYFHRPPWQRVLIRAATQGCSLNLFVSQLELNQCTSQFGLTNGRYFPHALQNEYLAGRAEKREPSLLNIAWSGRSNVARKGLPDLLEAVRLLRDAGRTVRLYLAGVRGDGAGFLQERIQALGLGESVQYLGELSREDKIRLLRTCEIYVQPSHFEGFGLATLEAMGCGACVIVTDVGAVREVVGDCGVYVPPASPEALARAILTVLGDEALRERLQAAALQRARERFSFDAKVEKLRELLQELGVAGATPRIALGLETDVKR